MTLRSATAVILMLFFSALHPLHDSTAAQQKPAAKGAADYVIQVGAYKDEKYAQEMIGTLRFRGFEFFLARKHNGLYVVQSGIIRTRGIAKKIADAMVAGKHIKSYLIITPSIRIISESSEVQVISKQKQPESVQTEKPAAIESPVETTGKPEARSDENPMPAGAVRETNLEDRASLTTLAWYHFRIKRYEGAYRFFSELNGIYPEQSDHLTGMILSLAEIQDAGKAMELAPALNHIFHTRILIP